jgi:UDP-N-acetylglucosamine 2-epimerase (non-hydrolysing)
VEAGLRTNDIYRPFPEEVNRRVTDAMTTLHFSPTNLSRKNLLRENIAAERIFVTGNTVIDALLQTAKGVSLPQGPELKRLATRLHSRMIFMTAHRRENFGQPFAQILQAVRKLAQKFPNVDWVYPVHPNPNVDGPARKGLKGLSNVYLIKPVDYADAVWLIKACDLVVTDSGGLQEEAPALGKPVLVLRDVTERPEAVSAGTVTLVGANENKIVHQVSRLLEDARAYRKMANAVNPYGDGLAAKRIQQAILWYFGLSSAKPRPFQP